MKRFSQPLGLSLLLWLVVLIPSHAANPVSPKILHVLNRLSLGPKPGDVARVQQIGVEQYIQQQLNPNSIPEPASLRTQLQSFETLSMSPVELVQEFGRPKLQTGDKPTPEEQKAYREKMRQIMEEAVQARLLRATASPRQLEEVMVDFWFNHFNVFAKKGQDRLWVGSYEQQAIRPHVFGRFRDLLGATAHHPAMLFYLDNWQNTDPNSPGARGRFKGLNENYARELMELHTLGVNGGYTQKDVVTLAKILTGWTIQRRPNAKNPSPQGFYFDAKRHDSSPKVFLGHTLQGKGQAEGEEALDILAASPVTARHISYQLAQYFVADKPPDALVKRLAQNYLSTGGNIKDLLKTLFRSPEFQDPKFYQAKFKTPYQYVLSAVRATGVEVRNVRPIYTMLQQLGMPLYEAQSPDGYKNTKDAWLNPDAMTRRLSFATALANGRIPLSADPESLRQGKSQPDRSQGSTIATSLDPIQLTKTLGNGFSLKTQQAIANNPPQLQSALLLGSPESMHR
jgi:uncharacterized protein (DUF1800 family)